MKKKDYHSTKVAIIGAGSVGSAVAYALTIKNVASEIILIDRNDTKEKGQVMDIADGICFVETGCIKGADYKDAANADVIIMTAGAAQKPGETRLDLVQKNIAITKSIFKQIGRIKKTAIIIMIANPVDILTYIVQNITKLPKNQVFGTGTALDTARLRTEIAHHVKTSPINVHGYALGEHGDSEFVAWSTVSVAGINAKDIKELTSKKKKLIEKRVKQEAYEIIKRKGATWYGIALTTSDIVEAILYNQHKIMPVSALITNWNGVSNVCIGVPAAIGRTGIEKIWPIKLTVKEKQKFKSSAKTLKSFL